MSVIQNIRDKYARIAVIAIAVSLIGFILMDALTGRSNIFSSNSTVIGSINGKKIEYVDFEKKIKQQEEQMAAQGMNTGDNRQQLVEQVWMGEINDVVMGDQYEKLGLAVTTREINDFLFGSNPPADLKQRFTDSTGVYNGAAAQQAINQLKKSGKPEEKEQLANYVKYLRSSRELEKYNSLLTNSIYMPKWFIEKQTADNALISKAAYVSVPYASIADSSVKVSNNEISSYLNNHRTEFEAKTESRSIAYVLFPAVPSSADSAAARNALLELKPAFDTAKNYQRFLAANQSTLPFYDGLVSKNAIQQVNKDSILAQPVGTTFGPYLDPAQGGAAFVLSRILEARSIADTVNVRHILIGTVKRDPQSGQSFPVRDDSTARKLADSVRSLLAAGQSFDSLVTKFSDDDGSKEKGGLYEDVTTGRMVGPFNDYAFTAPVGQVGVVKTDFGYHIMEVRSRKGATTGYKIAYLGRPIDVSAETETAAANAANQFASDSRSLEGFNQNADKLRAVGINKQVAETVRPLDWNIPGVGVSRTLVRNIYEASKGDVLQPEHVGNGYVVAVVTGVNKAGLMSVAAARPLVEPILRNKKKAAQIRQNLGAITTLEAAAAKLGQPVVSADSLHFNGNNAALGFEYKVIGAAFNPANKGKVVNEAIEGQAGVYVLRVDNISAVAIPSASVEAQRPMLTMQARQQAQGANNLEALKTAASIKDNRAKFY
ncbi:MAG: peptidylprolyl isomerase [Chitinophagaceae bacterium]|nr:MAG: peptidylprolyl isomerase [Chitinophagaceae bacterium]